MKQSDIAVIVLNWNGKSDSLACIDALGRQTLKHDIIAVDNGSEDSFFNEIQTNHPEIISVRNDKNMGFAGGVNSGIRIAIEHGYKYIALINNDAKPEKDWLNNLFQTIAIDKSTGIVTGKLLKTDGSIDSTGDLYTSWGLPYPRGRGEKDNGQYDKKQEVFAASGGASLYRVEMLKDIGLFDEDFFAYYEDVDISFRARLAGWKIIYEPKAVAYHKIGATSSKIKGFTTYQTIKNLPFLMWKNVPLSLMPKVLPRLFVAHSAIAFSALSRGHFIPVIKGYFMSCLLLPKKLYERHLIQSSKKISTDGLRELITFDLPPNAYKLRKIRSFFVR